MRQATVVRSVPSFGPVMLLNTACREVSSWLCKTAVNW